MKQVNLEELCRIGPDKSDDDVDLIASALVSRVNKAHAALVEISRGDVRVISADKINKRETVDGWFGEIVRVRREVEVPDFVEVEEARVAS